MPCQWSPTRACQFLAFTNELFDRDGRQYCWLHLPLGAGKRDGTTFQRHFDAFLKDRYTDFSGVAFPADSDGTRYDFRGDQKFEFIGCEFAPNITIVFNQETYGDFSNSRFRGASTIMALATYRSLVCHGVRFDGAFTLEAGDNRGDASFTDSRFLQAPRFNRIEGVALLNLTACDFRRAPTFGQSTALPLRIYFFDAKFHPQWEDEGAFRRIRNLFAAQRARDSEGKFYALEKRCHRLGLRAPREWVPRAISAAYDLSSEYGYSYGRALFWFCAVQVIFGVVYAWLSGDINFSREAEYDGRIAAFTFAQIVKPFELFGSRAALEGAYSILPQSNRGLWMFLTAAQTIVSLSLVALFLIALRWRFRRE